MMQIDLVYIWYDGKSFIDSGEEKNAQRIVTKQSNMFRFQK